MDPSKLYRLKAQSSLVLHIFYVFFIKSCQNLPEPDTVILVYLYKVMMTIGQKNVIVHLSSPESGTRGMLKPYLFCQSYKCIVCILSLLF